MSVSQSEELVPPISASSTAPLSPTRPKYKRNAVREELVVFIGEFIGTFIFLFLAFIGTQIALESATINPSIPKGENPSPEISKLIYISFSFGAALAVNVALFAEVSGGMFNPAVTTALWVIGHIKWKRTVHSIFAQLLASICSAAVVSALLPGPLSVVTVLSPSISITRGLFLETFLTAQLVLTILMLLSSSTKPIYIGLSLFVGQLCGVYFTGGSLNPARSFGPAVLVGFNGYHWIYWLGPLLGAGLASGAFVLINTMQGNPLQIRGTGSSSIEKRTESG